VKEHTLNIFLIFLETEVDAAEKGRHKDKQSDVSSAQD
jgi:hypothetical protein